MTRTRNVVYDYNKETDVVTATVTNVISFPFTHYHRDLILHAKQHGYVEIRGDKAQDSYHDALKELISIGVMEESTDAWYVTGLLTNKEQAMEFCKSYTEE